MTARMPESAVRPDLGDVGTTVRVRVLSDNGGTARVQVEDCGVLLRRGQVHTVPSDKVRRGEPIKPTDGEVTR